VARMGQERNVYKVLMGKSEGKRPFRKPRLDEMMESEWILGRLAGGAWIGSSWPRTGTVGAFL
jgi:hypothetical protein